VKMGGEKPKANCKQCGKSFTKNKWNQQYCEPACSKRRHADSASTRQRATLAQLDQLPQQLKRLEEIIDNRISAVEDAVRLNLDMLRLHAPMKTCIWQEPTAYPMPSLCEPIP
jgi:hypothetical protein